MPGIAYTLGLDASPALGGLNAVKGALGGLNGLVGKFAPLVGLAGGLGLAGAAVAGFKKSVDEAADMETLLTSFEVMLGSAGKAKALLEDLTAFAGSTPLEMPGIAEAARTLLNFGIAGDKVLPILKMLGDVSGGDAGKFASLALVFGQVSSAGKLAGQDLLQFINAGFNPLMEISKRTGQSMESLRKKMESGQIGIDMVQESFQHATAEGGQFFGMMDKQSRNWNGMMSTLQDGINAVFREFGMPILPELKPLLADAIGMTGGLAEKAREWGTEVAGAIALMRNAAGAGKLGELVGASLKVGFGEATEFFLDRLAEGIVGLKPIFAQVLDVMDTGMAAIGNRLAAAIKRAVAESLPDNIAFNGTRERLEAGARRNDTIAAGLGAAAKIQLEGVAGPALSDFLTKGLDDARGRLAQLIGEFAPREIFGPLLSELQAVKDASALAGQSPISSSGAAQRVEPMTDRLAKIGGFIGGAGGVRGQRAQEDTARYTRQLVDLTRETHRLLNQPRATGGATF